MNAEPAPSRPATVTVAVPLHRSARWVEPVVDNVRALPPDVTEVVVSDRTCVDDAAAVLRERLADDPRVHVVAEPRGIGWEDHYQLLAEEAAGELFMWMPHDDRFDASWTSTLAAALEARPEAWLAFGHVACVEVDGVTPSGDWPHPPPGVVAGWGALRMVLQGEMGMPFRGLWRREAVLDAGVRLAPRPDFHGVDVLWVFEVALRSALVYDERTETHKRFYPDSTFASWPAEQPGAHEEEVLALLHRFGPGGVEGAAMRAVTRAARLRGRLRPHLGPAYRRAKALAGRDSTLPRVALDKDVGRSERSGS